jgi:hypothetical protein
MINEMIVSLIISPQRGIHTNHRYENKLKYNIGSNILLIYGVIFQSIRHIQNIF